jgi:hypothetical protein
MIMRRTLISVVVAALLGTAVSTTATASRAWKPLSQETIDGVWEAVDYESAKAFRLEIAGNTAVLAITAGAKQGEFLFRSAKVLVTRGKVSFVAIEKSLDLSLRITGEGRVLDAQGRMTLKLASLNREATYWENIERVFVKGPAKSRLEALIEMDARAKALIDGTAQPCCAPHGSSGTQESPNSTESKDAKKAQ